MHGIRRDCLGGSWEGAGAAKAPPWAASPSCRLAVCSGLSPSLQMLWHYWEGH